MEQETVFVVGYPKSGCTWLTRLVAELLGCPVSGFLGEKSEDDMALEGQGRVSTYRVVRAHQQWTELEPHLNAHTKVIYVVRDPRDATISGAVTAATNRDQPMLVVLRTRPPSGIRTNIER